MKICTEENKSVSPVLVVGAGGHSRFVISLLQEQSFVIAGIMDINGKPDGREMILGVPVIWNSNDLSKVLEQGISAAFIAIGENTVRQTVYDKIRSVGFIVPNLIHASAQISSSARLGEGNIIGPCTVIGADVIVGDNNIINSGAIVEHETRLASHSHISLGAVMCGRASAGDLLMLGANATVLPGISLACNITVGAGAVVTRDIQQDTQTYAGVPAIRINR